MTIAAPSSSSTSIVEATARIVRAWLASTPIATAEVPALIRSVHDTLAGLDQPPAPVEPREPAVPIRSSVKPDYLVCLEDGMKLKMLKRHLNTAYGLTPEQYRQRWNLPPDYPMVAPNYSAARRTLAKKIGLGHLRRKAA